MENRGEALRLSSDSVHRPFELGARAGGKPQSAKPGVVFEEESEAVTQIRPPDNSAAGSWSCFNAFVGRSEGQEDLSTVRAPASRTLIRKTGVSRSYTPKV